MRNIICLSAMLTDFVPWCVLSCDLGGKSLKDNESLESLGLSKGGKLYFRDLGPQVGWTTVSLLIYLRYYFFSTRWSTKYM